MLQKIYRVPGTFKFILAGLLVAGSFWGWQAAQQESMVLLALDTHAGTVQWFHPLGAWDTFYSRGPLAANGTVILESAASSTPAQRFDTYQLKAFSAQAGEGLWAKQVAAPIKQTTASFGYELASNSVMQLQATAVYWQSGDELRSLALTTGQQRWSRQRPWFNTNERLPLWSSLGVAATQQRVGVVSLLPQRQQLQFLDAATGHVLRQTPLAATEQLTNFSRITQNDRAAFLTSSLATGADPLVVTAYNLDIGQRLWRKPFKSTINHLQAVGEVLLLSTDPIFNSEQPDRGSPGQLVALEAQTGRLLWQRADSQFQCGNYASTWQADPQAVYLNCDRRSNGFRGSSTIVALSTQTGVTRWQTVVSPNEQASHAPMSVGERQLLTLRQVNQGNRVQTQAITLDRQTGTLLWTHALFGKRLLFFRSRVATEGQQFFLLDEIPHWQLWLLKLNRHWYLNQALTFEKN